MKLPENSSYLDLFLSGLVLSVIGYAIYYFFGFWFVTIFEVLSSIFSK